jgi:hypothetical protein
MQAKLIVGWRIDAEKALAFAKDNPVSVPPGLCIARLTDLTVNSGLYLTLSHVPKVNFDWESLQREVGAVDWALARRMALCLGSDDVPFQVLAEPSLRSQQCWFDLLQFYKEASIYHSV